MVLRKISTFATVVTGGTPSTRNKEYWKNGDIPWLPSGVCQDCIVESAPSFITRLGLDCSAAKMMPPDTVLIALTGATAGKVGYLTFDASANQSVTGILPGKDHVPKYVFYFLQSRRKKTLADCYGGAQPHISQGYVKNIEVPLLPLDDQKRIADELDQLCALKKNVEDRLAILGQIAKSLFVEMFGEQESAKYPLLEIGSLFKVGGPKRIHQREWTEEGVPFLRVSDVVSKIKGDISLPAMYISNDRYAELKEAGAVPSAGDILVTARGTLGECYIVKADDAFYFQDGMITWLSAMDGRLDVTYIVNAMRQDGFRRQFLGKEVGSTVAYLSISQLAKLKVIVPPLPLQRQFAAFIEQLDKSQFTLRETIATLDQLYRAKLQEYFG